MISPKKENKADAKHTPLKEVRVVSMRSSASSVMSKLELEGEAPKKCCCCVLSAAAQKVLVGCLVISALLKIALVYYLLMGPDPSSDTHFPEVVRELTNLEAVPLEGNVKLTSFNILAEIWEGSGTEPQRNAKIVEWIKTNSPDILLLQEAQKSSVEFIKKNTDYELVSFPSHAKECWDDWLDGRPWQENGQAIFVKKRIKKSILKVEALNISKPGEDAFRVPAMTLNMKSKSGGNKKVTIVNVHLWYGTNGGKRLLQLNRIKRYIDKQQGKDKKNEDYFPKEEKVKPKSEIDYVMYAGDFNDVTGSLLAEQKELGFRNHGVDHGLEHVDTCANGQFSLRIDHVISSPEIKSVKFDTPNENEEKFGFKLLWGSLNSGAKSWFTGMINREKIIEKYGSDHLPITSTFHVSQ